MSRYSLRRIRPMLVITGHNIVWCSRLGSKSLGAYSCILSLFRTPKSREIPIVHMNKRW